MLSLDSEGDFTVLSPVDKLNNREVCSGPMVKVIWLEESCLWVWQYSIACIAKVYTPI